MRIIQITPGSGDSFYCENCLRDRDLVRAFRRAGHEALLVPLYLPPLGEFGGDAPIFFGGVNVYLQQKSALFRHTPRWLDRLLDSPRLLRWAASKAGMTSARDLGETTLSMLRGAGGRQRKELDRLVRWLASQGRPDAVTLSNALLLGLTPRLKSALRAPIVCYLQDEDEFADALPPDLRSQAWSMMADLAREVDAFVAPSRYYADFMIERLRLPPERVSVVYASLDWSDHRPADALPPPVVGYFSRMSAGKGLDLLVEAVGRVRSAGRVGDVRLRAAGGMTDADRPFVDSVRRRIDELHLAGDAELLPNLVDAEKVRFLQSLSVLSVPERHGEAAGLYVLEAMAAGVPVVQPATGAFPELIEAAGGGVLFEPGSVESLAQALEKLLADPAGTRRMGFRAREAVLEKFSLDRAMEGLLAVFRRADG